MTSLKFFIIFCSIVILAACPLDLKLPDDQIEMITIISEEVTLEWDDTNSELSILYRIYYKAHEETDWIFLTETNLLYVKINNVLLDYGKWDFAVSAILNQVESELHTCFDDTATPSTGWYLNWLEHRN